MAGLSFYPGWVTGYDGSEGDDIVEQGDVGFPRPDWFTRLRGWPSRGALILGAAGLVLGLLAGYAAGYREVKAGARPAADLAATGSSPPSALPPPAASSPNCGPGASGPPIAWPPFPTGQDGRALLRFCASTGHAYVSSASAAVTQTTGACSVQLGHELQLGVEVSNQTSSDVTVQGIVASLPRSGGLRPVSWAWGPCGALSSGAGQVAADLAGGEDLSPGENGWFTMTFQVLVKCPGPFPVQFIVQIDSNGRTSSAQVPGFSDLGQVPYSGCPGN
jgi:hypothetical protein